MILGSLLLKREGLLYMALCGCLFSKNGIPGRPQTTRYPETEKIIPLVMPIAHAEGI